ncbi:hypothetical protein BC826DRAFT_953581, partial [Russula brevipes]
MAHSTLLNFLVLYFLTCAGRCFGGDGIVACTTSLSSSLLACTHLAANLFSDPFYSGFFLPSKLYRSTHVHTYSHVITTTHHLTLLTCICHNAIPY